MSVKPPHCLRLLGADVRDYLDYRHGSGNSVEIYDIAVGSERRKGIGTAMFRSLLATLKRSCLVFAIARSENRVAQQFYLSIGFRVVGVLCKFYQEGDAIMYGYDLRV